VRFCGQKDSIKRIFINKCFLITAVSVCGVKRFISGSKNSLKDADVETEVRKWLRQPSKDFPAAGIDALVMRWDTCIKVGGGYVEK
jgi:hypothetical protein